KPLTIWQITPRGGRIAQNLHGSRHNAPFGAPEPSSDACPTCKPRRVAMTLSRCWLAFKSYRAVFSYRRTLFGVFLIAICLTLTGSRTPNMLERILAEGEIRVLSRNGPTTYYQDSNGITGFEYTLLQGFADFLGVKLILE